MMNQSILVIVIPETSVCLHTTSCSLPGVLVYNVLRILKKQSGKKHQKFCYTYMYTDLCHLGQ